MVTAHRYDSQGETTPFLAQQYSLVRPTQHLTGDCC